MADERDVLQTTIVVEQKGESYTFSIPGYLDEIKLGMQERDIRRQLSPSGDPTPDGLDYTTYLLVRAAAVFQVLLRKASVEWVWSKDKDGKPVVLFENFPSDKVEEVLQVNVKFTEQLEKFRRPGTADADDAGTEDLAGQPDPGNVALQSGPAPA